MKCRYVLIAAAALTGCFYPEMLELSADAGARQSGGAPQTSNSSSSSRPAAATASGGSAGTAHSAATTVIGGSLPTTATVMVGGSAGAGGVLSPAGGSSAATGAGGVLQPAGGSSPALGTGGVMSPAGGSSPVLGTGGIAPPPGGSSAMLGTGGMQGTGGSLPAAGGVTQSFGGSRQGGSSSTSLTGGAVASGGTAVGGSSAASSKSCGARNCLSTEDNDCNGIADVLESACIHCAESSPRSCDSHPGCDNIGLCHAGSQTLNIALDNTTCEWSPCSESQGPTEFEACGPTKPDANCNGIAGDGTNSGCVQMLYVFEGPSQPASSGGPAGYAGGIMASTSSSAPHANWQEIAHYNVFTKNEENTVALRMCQVSDVTYLKIGNDYTTLTSAYNGPYVTPTDLGIVGYLATAPGAGYVPLDQFTQTLTSYPSSLVPISNVPVVHGKCPAGRSCSASTLYTLPDVVRSPACL